MANINTHALEVPFSITVKPYVTSPLVTSPLTPKLLQRIVLAGVESEGELTRPSVDTSAPLELSFQKVVKGTSQSTKLPSTKGHTSIMMANSNTVNENFLDFKFSHPVEVPFSTTGKPGDENEGELTRHSTSARDRQVGTTISSTSQSLQSTTIVKDEGMPKLVVTVLPSKFTERPSQSTKLLTTERHASLIMENTNDVDKKFPDSEFSHPSEVPFSTTGKPYVTQSFVTLPSTPRLLQRIVLAGVEREGELTSRSTSTRDRQVGTTISSPSQSLQSTTIVKDEGMLKLVTVLPSKFTDRPSALIKVKNATQPGNSLLGAHQDISSTDSRSFRMSEHCCKVSIENRTSHPEGNGNNDSIALTDNRTGHFHTLIDELMPAASSTTQFPVAQRVMTISAQSKNDSELDLAEQTERVVSKLTQSKPLISASDSMHHLATSDHPDQSQKIPTTPSQIPPREIQNLSPIFEGHAVTYSPVRQRLISSLTGRAKPLTFLSSLTTGHTPFHHPGRVLKGHPSIVPLGHSASPPELVTFQDLENTQDSTSFQTANIKIKNTEPTVFQKLLTPHSERLIRTTNTWPVTGKSSVNSFSAQFTSTAGSDKGSTVLLSVSSLSTALLHHFLAASHEKSNGKKTDKAMQQDLVSNRSQTDVLFFKPSQSEITEPLGVDSGDLDDANQMVVTEQPQPKENHDFMSHSVSTSMENIHRKKAAGTMDVKSIVSTQSPLKQESEQSRSAAETKAESSTGAFILDQNAQNAFSMQNKDQTPATVLMENTVSSSQSQSQRGKDLRKTTEGQIDASVTPAAVESLRSTQPLASLAAAVAETPKMVEQMINQASSPGSTLSSIIDAASEGKDFNKKRVLLSVNQTTQREPNASAINHLQAKAASSQAPGYTRAPKRHLINNEAINHLTLNPKPPSYTPPPAPKATNILMRSDRNTSQSSSFTPLLRSSPSFPSTPSRILTNFSTTSSTSNSRLYNIQQNIIQEDSPQTSRSSVTQATFFNFDHNYGSTASFESTAAESPQTASLQILETMETSETSGRQNEGRLSTVFPSETSLSKSAEMMSDLPVMQRRMRIASPDFLSGLAQISDDICGSGNYTAEMRLTLERDIEPGDLIPALGNLHVVINLKTNNTQVNLEIKSCCLSPTVTLDQFNTTCCLFSRLPIDPQGIRLLPSVLSKRASFTISLFQMINYSTAYLHCDLSVCLRNSSECERCQQNRKARLSDEEEIIFSYTANRISFGPVLKETGVSPFIETTGLDGAEAAAVVVSVSGCFLVCVALLLLWTFYRRRSERSGHCWTPYGCSRNGEHVLP
ncbi:mucin-5AC-like [Astyanax mexicanus]|uniref:Mucin-5AC-like n=1 Tax=Astyanax mexicanus TaxID=7994 RepID=A0A8T2L5Y6_ASTMX|nr:mucin-5AC-like [Astyanax mexicanus]